MPDQYPQNIDVAKLHKLLENTAEHQQIGRRVLRAIIIDVLRSKSGRTPQFWFRRIIGDKSRVGAVLHEIIDNVSLTDKERRILDELEKEEEDGHSLSD